MNPLHWSWQGLFFAAVAYWLVIVLAWVSIQRLRRLQPPTSMRRVSERTVVMTLDDSLDLRRAGLVLLGPPLVLLAARWLVGG